MSEQSLPSALTWGLYLSLAILVPFGVLLLLAPMLYFELAGSTPFDKGFIRWGGAPLLAFAYLAIRVLRDARHTLPIVDGLTLAFALAALAHTVTFVTGQYSGQVWVILIPLLGAWPAAILLFVGCRQAEGLLR